MASFSGAQLDWGYWDIIKGVLDGTTWVPDANVWEDLGGDNKLAGFMGVIVVEKIDSVWPMDTPCPTKGATERWIYAPSDGEGPHDTNAMGMSPNFRYMLVRRGDVEWNVIKSRIDNIRTTGGTAQIRQVFSYCSPVSVVDYWKS